ncbi:MAG: thiamine phosphate synthase [Alphaproteobacteria bacterium]|nr:thiamine phosphate synthase [Alphaproteobacteria bacterium]
MNHCRLYLISPPAIELPKFAESLKAAFDGGDVGSFQLRLKNASDAEVMKAAEKLIPICHAHGTAFIMNDRPDLAVKCGADGVHLGQEDLETMPISKAREIIGEQSIIGVSCHDSRHLAMDAGEAGADYVAFGAFYPTKSKDAAKLAKYGVPTAEILSWWAENTVLPCVAIGGMTPANSAPLAKAGADFIAVITAVWEHPDGPKKAVEEFNRAIERTAI